MTRTQLSIQSLRIPQDIVEHIIAAIHVDDRPLLKSCALLSHFSLRPSRKKLFSKIIIKRPGQCEKLYRLLTQTPAIRLFIKTLYLLQGYDEPLLFNNQDLLSILLLPLCRLENLEIHSVPSSFNWDDLSKGMKLVLWDAIHSSTSMLTTLTLSRLINIPIKLFLGPTQLQTLELRDVDLDDHPESLIPDSVPVTSTSSYTGIERYIWRVYDRLDLSLHELVCSIRLPFLSDVRSLELDGYLPNFTDEAEPPAPAFDILQFPATLEHLTCNIRLGRNNLKDIIEDLRGTRGVWTPFDAFVTQLRRLDINISFVDLRVFDEDSVDVPVKLPITEEDIQGLMLEKLPILREKGILFVRVSQRQ